MVYTLTELSTYYDAMNNIITQLATSSEISTLTTLVTNQHTELMALIAALTVRVASLEEWKLAHMTS